MTAFVILAAGRGSRIGRVGDALHKALVPLEGRAILSHLFDMAPDGARLIVCLGHRAHQIRDYVALAHPDLDVTFIYVGGWDEPGGGPGRSLLAARSSIAPDEDFVFTSCDTLWTEDPDLWEAETSWAGVAPMPVGSTPERWCRLRTMDSGRVAAVLDKTADRPDIINTYVGLSMIKAQDAAVFWDGVQGGSWVQRELQVTGGFDSLIPQHRLFTRHIHWTDVGDEQAYQRAIIEREGYDWNKSEEATWRIPEQGRVVKFWEDETIAKKKTQRASTMPKGAVPRVVDNRANMLAYSYAHGGTVYEMLPDVDIEALLDWADQMFWKPRPDALKEGMFPHSNIVARARDFYATKTRNRIARIVDNESRHVAWACLERIDWTTVVTGVEPCRWHGDFNFGNIIYDPDLDVFTGIDWRTDFAGVTEWGDKRYDVAKLLIGCRLNWDRIRHGDFAPWTEGAQYERTIRDRLKPGDDVDQIAVLALLSSAPLHGSPLDDVLVTQAARWMESIE